MSPGRTNEATAPTVLVVDDEVIVQDALARLSRARDAGRHLRVRPRVPEGPRPRCPACLVLDVRIAEENGLRVQQALRPAAWYPPSSFSPAM
jgi:FixJ family two-component response regulator